MRFLTENQIHEIATEQAAREIEAAALALVAAASRASVVLEISRIMESVSLVVVYPHRVEEVPA